MIWLSENRVGNCMSKIFSCSDFSEARPILLESVLW